MPRRGESRRLKSFAALIAAFAFSSLASAMPVSAGGSPASSHRADASIRLVCSGVPEWRNCDPAWVGDGIYNKTAKNQKRAWTDFLTYSNKRDPRVVVFKISIQNKGSVADSFRVSADGITSGYRVKFVRGSTNITSAVENGTYQTPALSPGASFVIQAKVVMPCDSWDDCGQDRATRLVTVRSVGDSSARDAVKFVRKIWVCGC